MIDGTLLKSLRKEQGLTLQALADKANLAKSFVWELENDTGTRPSLVTGFALADALGVNLYVLVGRQWRSKK